MYVGEHVLEDAALSVEITLSHLYPGNRSVHRNTGRRSGKEAKLGRKMPFCIENDTSHSFLKSELSEKCAILYRAV